MDIYPSLFEGQLICLAPIDYDKDPQTEAGLEPRRRVPSPIKYRASTPAFYSAGKEEV